MKICSRAAHDTCNECSSTELERLRVENDLSRQQARTLLSAQTDLLTVLNTIAFAGSRLIAEARGLGLSERRQLLDIFAMLHSREDVFMRTRGQATASNEDAS